MRSMRGLEEMMLLVWFLASALAQEASLVVHYPFDGTAEDVVTGEVAMFDGEVSYGFGPVGDAAELSPSAVIDVGPVLPDGRYSVAFYALWSGERGQLHMCDVVRAPQVFFAVDSQIRIGGRQRLAQSGRWNHIVWTWDDDVQRTYINGVVDMPVVDAFDNTPLEDGACVLGDPNSRSELELFVDDFRVYSGVVDQQVVDELVGQWDTDGDGIGDVADNCPDLENVDQVDRDVDGVGDACDPTPDPPDTDGDGIGDPLDRCVGDDALGDTDNDGWCADDDCDDRDATVNPGAEELCDGMDTDCDGDIPFDEGDSDGDGWFECEECDDGDPEINPGAPEVCDDGLDNNCSGAADSFFECGIDCGPSANSGCLCSVGPGPVVGGWTLLLLAFASRRRQGE